ncbi:pyridoxamine 5'-phosphate oxidase [Dactylosporangium sp. NPDC051485]|uniref:pyridoxamine 5'-phosphate oxidase n=1 Tax=Dactylosporangium sp. NPDC051485 TaxID=3154846 RepID=UPI00344467DC
MALTEDTALSEIDAETVASLPQGDVRLLLHPVAQRLLVSRELARVAYVGLDGAPRVLPIMFHWNGTEVILASFWNAAKIRALRVRPEVALTIDSSVHPPEILLIRGRAVVTDVDGVAPEFIEANLRYGGPEFGASRIREVDHPGVRMHRIAIKPEWVGVLDFKTRFSGQRTAAKFSQRGRTG